jgi:hypothetical protein
VEEIHLGGTARDVFWNGTIMEGEVMERITED